MGQFTIYRSTDSGAPALSGTAGALCTVLDACLVNGWTASVTSITRSGTTATVTTATAHGLNTGNSTTIAGASQSDYNITAVVTVISSTVFTIQVANSPATPATGTITWKKLGAGWTIEFTATNKRSYRQPAGNMAYVAVDDAAVVTAKEARMTLWDTMTAIQSGNLPTPTAAQGIASGTVAAVALRKSTTADGTARAWIIVADGQTFYVFTFTGDNALTYMTFGVGEFYSFLPGDLYRNFISGSTTENTGVVTNYGFGQLSAINANVTGFFLQRGYLGVGGSVAAGKHTDAAKNAGVAYLTGSIPFPNATDGGIYVAPMWIHDITTGTTTSIRGRLRGFLGWMHPATAVSDGDTFQCVGDFAGKSMLIIKYVNSTTTASGIGVIETSATLETN